MLSADPKDRLRADQARPRPLRTEAAESASSPRIKPETGHDAAIARGEGGDGRAVAPAALAHVALVDLVDASEASTRLVNALNRAHHRRTLPFSTIGAYVAAGDSAKDAMLAVQGIGRKVADELDTLVVSALAASPKGGGGLTGGVPPAATGDSSVPTARLCAERLAELVDDVPFPGVLFGFSLPTRLEKLLRELHGTGRLPVRTLGGYLRRKREVHAFLSQQRNCGRKSLVALEDLCASILQAVLVRRGRLGP